MLCAAWELYVEELAVEVAKCLADRANSPEHFPLGVQKKLAKHVREHKHELKPLKLAGDGWEQVYMAYVNEIVGSLNTPKAGPINEIYSKVIGWESPSAYWTHGKDFINQFVTTRGDIAHQGSAATYVNIKKLGEYRESYAQKLVTV